MNASTVCRIQTSQAAAAPEGPPPKAPATKDMLLRTLCHQPAGVAELLVVSPTCKAPLGTVSDNFIDAGNVSASQHQFLRETRMQFWLVTFGVLLQLS